MSDEAGRFTAEHTVMGKDLEIRELKHLLEVKDKKIKELEDKVVQLKSPDYPKSEEGLTLYFDDIFTSVKGQHPPILKYFLSKKINLETFMILDDILQFSKHLNEKIQEKVLWPKLYDRMIRYKPFLTYNTTKLKMVLKKKLKEM